jgi:hypothetical protein
MTGSRCDLAGAAEPTHPIWLAHHGRNVVIPDQDSERAP